MIADQGPVVWPGPSRSVVARVVVLTGAGFSGALVVLPPPGRSSATGAILACWLLVGTWIAVEDVRDHRVPNRLVAAMSVIGVGGFATIAALGQEPVPLVAAFAWAAVTAGLAVLVHLVSDGAIGMGDVKLVPALVVGLVAGGGPNVAWEAFAIALGLAAATLAARAVFRSPQTPLPAAPLLVGGSGAALLLA